MPDTLQESVPVLTYDQARDVYEKARLSPLFKDMSMAQFSQLANEAMGTPVMTAGLSDNVLKYANYQLNKVIGRESTVGRALGGVGADVATGLGYPQYADIGRNIAASVPRGLLETGLLFAAPESTAARVGLRGLGALMSGTEATSQTGSLGAGLATGALGLAMPPVVHGAERLAVKPFANVLGLTKSVEGTTPGLLTGKQLPWQRASTKALETAARNLAFTGVGEAQIQASSVAATGQLAPLTDEHLVELGAGQAAFALLDLLGVVRPNVKSRVEQLGTQARIKQTLAEEQARRDAVREINKSALEREVAPPAGATTRQREAFGFATGYTLNRLVKLQKALGTAEPSEIALDDMLHYPKNGVRTPFGAAEAQAVQKIIEDKVASSDFEVKEGKLVAKRAFDLTNWPHLQTKAEKDARRILSNKAQLAVAGEILKGGETGGGGDVQQATPKQPESVVQGGQAEAKGPTAVRQPGEVAVWDQAGLGERMDYLDALLGKGWRKSNPALADTPLANLPEALRPSLSDTGIEAIERTAGRGGETRATQEVQGKAVAAQTVPGAKGAAVVPPVWDWTPRKPGEQGPAIDLRQVPEDRRAQYLLEDKLGTEWFAARLSARTGLPVSTERARVVLQDMARPIQQRDFLVMADELAKELKALRPKVLEAAGPTAQKYERRFTTGLADITDLESAKRFVNETWERVWREVQGAWHKVEVKIRPTEVMGQPSIDIVRTTSPRTIGTEPGLLLEQQQGRTLADVHRQLVEAAIAQLKTKGVEADYNSFSARPPEAVLEPLGWDEATVRMQELARGLDTAVSQIGQFVVPHEAGPFVQSDFPKVEPTAWQRLALAQDQVADLHNGFLGLDDPTGRISAALTEGLATFEKAIDAIRVLPRQADEAVQMYHGALQQRIERLTALQEEVKSIAASAVLESLQRRQARMNRWYEQGLLKSWGVPDDIISQLAERGVPVSRTEQVRDTINKYVEESQRAGQGNGQIVKALVDVLSKPKDSALGLALKRRVRGGGVEHIEDDAAQMINAVALFALMDWTARLIDGRQALIDTAAGKPAMPLARNIWDFYKGALEARRTKEKGPPPNDYEIARAGIVDLLKQPSASAEVEGRRIRTSTFGRGSPALRYAKEAATSWWDDISDAVHVATTDLDDPRLWTAEGELTGMADEAVRAWHARRDTLAGRGAATPGSFADSFHQAVWERMRNWSMTAKDLEDAPMADVRFTVDQQGIDWVGTVESRHKLERMTPQAKERRAAVLAATAKILVNMQDYRLVPEMVEVKLTKSGEPTMAGTLRLKPDQQHPLLELKWNVIRDAGMVSPALQGLREFLYGERPMVEKLDTLAAVLRDADVPPEVKQLASDAMEKQFVDALVRAEVEKGRRAGEEFPTEAELAAKRAPIAEGVRKDMDTFLRTHHGDVSTFFRQRGKELVAIFKKKVDSSYTNWDDRYLSTTLKLATGAVLEKQPRPVAGAAVAVGVAKPFAEFRAPPTEGQLAAGLYGYFTNYFSRLGLPPQTVNLYATIAGRIGAAFPGLSRGQVVGLVSDRYGGMYVPLAARRFLVGLNGEVFKTLPPKQQALTLMHMAAHEVSHALYGMAGRQNDRLTASQLFSMEEAKTYVQSLGDEGRYALMQRAFGMVLPIYEKDPAQRTILETRLQQAYDSPEEFLMDFTALSLLGVANPDPNVRQHALGEYLFSEAHVQKVLDGFFVPLLDIGKPLAEYLGRTAPGETAREFSAMVEHMKGVVTTTASAVQESFAALQRLEAANPSVFAEMISRGWNPLETITPKEGGGLAAVIRHMDPELGELFTTTEAQGAAIRRAGEVLFGPPVEWEKYAGRTISSPIKWFFVAGQLAKKYPVLDKMFSLAFRYFGMTNDAVRQIAGPMMKSGMFGLTQKLDYEGTGLKVVLQNEDALHAFNVIGLLKQGTVETGEKMQVFSEAKMREMMTLMGLTSEKKQNAVMQLHRNCEDAAERLWDKLVAISVDTSGARYAGRLLMKLNQQMTADAARDAGVALAKQVWQAKLANQALETLGFDETMLGVAKSVDAGLQPLLEFVNRTANSKRAWMPEVRLGKWAIVYWERQPDGKWKPGFQAAESRQDRDTKIAALQRREAASEDTAKPGQVIGIRGWDRWEHAESYKVGGPIGRLLAESTRNATMARMIDLGIDKAHIDAMFAEDWTPADTAMRQAEERTMTRITEPRKIAPGRETVNMAQNFIHFMNYAPRAFVRMMVDAEAALRLDDPTIRGNDAFKAVARHHFDNVVHPQAKEWTNTKKFIFAYFMGFNLSSLLIEPTQQVIVHMPTLTRDMGSAYTAYKAWSKGVRLALAHRRGKSTDLDFNKAMDEARANQLYDFGVTQEFYSAEDYLALNVSSMLNGAGLVWNAKKLAKSVFNLYVNTARRLYSVAPAINNVAAFASSYIAARDFGVFERGRLVKKPHAEAVDYALLTTRASMGGGGTAGRPVELFHKAGTTAGVVGAMYSLATYSFLVLSHLVRLMGDAIDRRGELSPAERWAARKALGQTLMAQAAFAGVLMGMPMATGMLAVLEQLFPNLQAAKAVEDTVQQLVDEDDTAGGFWSDLVMRGVPYAAAGIDTSARLQLSNVLGISQYDGFKLENLVGPAGSIIGNVVRATQTASRGRWGDAFEGVLPTAFKNIVRNYRDSYDGRWMVRDWQGKPLYEPTGAELAMDLVGFRPAAVSKLRDAMKLAKRADEIARTEGGIFTDKVARQLVEGDVVGARTELLKRERELPGFSALEGARSVADKATKMLFPLDFAREGVRVDAATRQRLAVQGGVRPTPEVQWIQTRKRLEALLGIPGAAQLRPGDLRLAMLVDQLRAQNPMLSVQEAREQALLLLGHRPAVLRGY